jgi:hypothetical protein
MHVLRMIVSSEKILILESQLKRGERGQLAFAYNLKEIPEYSGFYRMQDQTLQCV